MMKVYFDGQTEGGAVVQNAFVWLSEDYTMRQLVNAIKDNGYVLFKTRSMNRFAKIS